jgi:hypothetical protein
MKIVSGLTPRPGGASDEMLTALKKEVEHLKEQLSAVRRESDARLSAPAPIVIPVLEVSPEPVAVPAPAPVSNADSLFSEMWSYVNARRA